MLRDSKIVFDCDGVLLDFVTSFNGYVEVNGAKYSPDPPHYDFNWCDDPDRIKSLLVEYLQEQVVAPIMDENLPTFMETLMENGNHISIVSIHPFERARVNNLISVGIFPGRHYHEIYCCRSEKEKLDKIRELRPDYYFEDCPEFIEKICAEASLAHMQLFVPTYYAYTSHTKDIIRILKYRTFDSGIIVSR